MFCWVFKKLRAKNIGSHRGSLNWNYMDQSLCIIVGKYIETIGSQATVYCGHIFLRIFVVKNILRILDSFLLSAHHIIL